MNKAGRMQNLRRLVWLPKRCSSANQNANSTENRAVNLQLLPRDRIRNIGIVAHVDAGKTTVTEQLLFLTGATRVVGNVDAGNTVTDFLDMERERGITIQSAAVSFDWLDHRINLIDTPGHVDFTVEVERCVRVLDGVVAVLDASAGVQAQTLTVWKQASKYGLPSAFFVNKLDKKGANFGRCVNDVEQKLGVKAMCTVVPHTRADGSLVLVDLLNGNAISMSSRDASWTKIEKPSTRESDVLEESRSDLFYALADVDDVFMAHFLDECGGDVNRVDHDALIGALRGATVSGSAATVSCGSALKSTNCTRTILDHVVQFLPSPSERHGACASIFDDQFAGLVFKVTHEKRKGKLSYIRVYNGSLKSNTSVFNSSQGRSEGPVKIFHAYADELRPMDRTGAGSIAVVSGLHHAVTGDTLLTSESAGKKAYHTFQEVRGRLQNAQANEHDHHRKLANQVATATADQQILDRKLAGRLDSVQVHPKTDAGESTVVFAGIDAPESVYFCNVEPPSSRKMHEFESALNELAMEDPSIKVRRDPETGQTIVETQGELHMEVVKDRLVRGYGLDVFVGPLQVAYKEVLSRGGEHSAAVEEKMGEKGRVQSAAVRLRVEPLPINDKFQKVELDLEPGAPPVRHEWQRAINEGCRNALHNGPLGGFPVHGIRVQLLQLTVSGGKINPALLSACTHKCMTEALQKGETRLVEPIVQIQISVGNGENTQPLLQELAKRRTQISNCEKIDEETSVVEGKLPLAETENLARVVRTLTSGFGFLHVQVCGYQVVSEGEEATILRNLRGQ